MSSFIDLGNRKRHEHFSIYNQMVNPFLERLWRRLSFAKNANPFTVSLLDIDVQLLELPNILRRR